MALKPAGYDFSIFQGASFERVITITDDEGVPWDLTNFDAVMQLRQDVADKVPTVLLELTIANGRIVKNGVLGKLTLVLTAVETEALKFILAKHDLKLIDAAGTVFRVLEGTVTISREVTRV